MTEVDSVLPEGSNSSTPAAPAAASSSSSSTTTTTVASTTTTPSTITASTKTTTTSSSTSSSSTTSSSTTSAATSVPAVSASTSTVKADELTKATTATTTTKTTTAEEQTVVATATATTTPAATNAKTTTTTNTPSTEATKSIATKTATSNTKDNGVALADAPSVAIGGGGGGGSNNSSSMAPSDSVQTCKDRRPDAANDAVKPMDVDDADAMRDGARDVDGEEDDSQITSSTENGGGDGAGSNGADGNGDDVADGDVAKKSKRASPTLAKRAVTQAAASLDGSKTDGVTKAQNLAARTPQSSDANSDTNSNSGDEAPTSGDGAAINTNNANSKTPNSSAIGGDNKSNNSNNVATAAAQKPVEKSSAVAVVASTAADDADAKTRAQSEEGEDAGDAKVKQAANNNTTSSSSADTDAVKSPKTPVVVVVDKPTPTKSERADEQKSNGNVHVGSGGGDQSSSAKAEPMDTSVPNESPLALASGKKENGIAGDIERAKDDIVSLDDDTDEEEEEVEQANAAVSANDPLALSTNRSSAATASNGDVTTAGAAAPTPKDGVNMSMPKKSLSSDSDGAVIIGSDSENEAVTVQSRPLPLPLPPPPLAVVQPKDLAKAKPETQVIDDDDDDCVVIEDDTPAPIMSASDLSKRKSGAFDGSNNADESQPPYKRQRNNNGTAIPTPMNNNNNNNSINQITIKDARSLMPQEIGTKRGADGNIYPVTITPAQSLMQQGPPKLVPMTNAGTLPLPVLPGLTCNANLLPGLTDDMFVLEAPSFIVPYIYEKPPPDNLKDVIKDIQAKHQLSKEDLAEADKSDEFDMITEQNKEDRDEKDSTASSSSKNKRKRRRGDDESWSEESDEDEDDDDDDSESGMRTKVLIKEASDDLTAIKGAIKPAAAVVQSPASAAGMGGRPGQENYFESPLGKFFMDIGVGLVQEFVQSDLIRLQKRKMRKSIGKNITEFERAITALSGNLEASKKKNSPFKFTMKRCEFCNFKSESALAMANHYETPHMHGIQYKCNFCTFEIRNATEIVYHMEAIHNIKARLIKPLPYHQCPNCGFEDNGKAKLARHHPVCAKKFRPELNLAPPTDWEAPAKIPRIKPRHGLVGTATAYQAMAAQAAAQKAALASIQQQQQAAQARSLQAAALAAQTAANKIRGRPPMIQKPPAPGPSPPSLLRGPSTVRNPMPTNVVLPNNFQMAANQLLPHAANAMSKKNMPSVSITPLPRQSAVPPAATPSTSKLPPAGMKPGQSPNSTGKTQFVICEICDYYIKDLEQLRHHMQTMHKVKIHPKMIYNRPPLNCQKCQFRFFTDQGLERHLLGSHGLVTSSMQEAANKSKDGGRCPVCGKTYLCKLLNHVSRDHHMTLKPAHLSYKCTVCTATFGMYKQFETHVYTAHSTVAKKAMDAKKSNTAPNAAASSSNNQRNNIGMYNESLLKPLKINDEITIIPQPASKPRITNMESHVID